jgi:serine/threonine protein kinase
MAREVTVRSIEMTTHFEPGTVLGRKYRIDGLIAEGGMGIVYRGWHVILEQVIAIKVLRPEHARHPLGVPAAKRRPWVALIAKPRADKSVYLGSYAIEGEAAVAHDRAALHYHGSKTPQLNYPDKAHELVPADGATLRAEAHAKMKEKAASRFRGVYWHKGAWASTILVNGRHRYLGRFLTEEAAARAWDNVALKHRGQKAKLNFDPKTGKELRGLKRLCDLEAGERGLRSPRAGKISRGRRLPR